MLLLIMAGTPATALAQIDSGQDTRLRLDQQLDRQRAAQEERSLNEVDEGLDAPSSLVIDGKTYAVGNNVDEMGQALHIAVSRRQWGDARRFLKAYENFPDRDPMLMLFANGAVARQDGKLDEAEGFYREMLVLDPGFASGQLELARVLFENRKDREARQTFESARALLVVDGDKASGVIVTIDAFLNALRHRRGWQGNLAIGPIYSTNINQSSESYTCLLATDDGTCVVDRKVPDAIKGTGINVEGALSRYLPLSGHHGLRGRAILFGEIYPDHHDFSQGVFITRLGYQYQTGRNTLGLSPSFDLGTLGSSVLYEAWGANAEWQHTASRNVLLRLEANYRDFRYRLPGSSSQTGPMVDVNLTVWYAPSQDWTLFGGPDFTDKDTPSPTDSYRQFGARFGINKTFGSDASILLLGSYRHREHRGFSALFDAKRREDQFNATAIARFPALRFAGLTPEIVVQHNQVKSNIDWLFSYKRTTASVRLGYAF
ncbi:MULTISPECIES: surface lipoprotein assembly modifier [Sphingomonadales]|uniref:surface lipoprotein assembly modifier n=1 Tax=Sphingomonadales TaxID=204457 RepID=UPI001FE35EBE|nr:MULTISPECIES: surface lipoprotein assembly modifier [Sphingomonadaceae]